MRDLWRGGHDARGLHEVLCKQHLRVDLGKQRLRVDLGKLHHPDDFSRRPERVDPTEPPGRPIRQGTTYPMGCKRSHTVQFAGT